MKSLLTMERSHCLVPLLLILTVFYCCVCEVIEYTDCTDKDPKGLCKINEIRVNPCREATSKKPCNLKKGKTYNIQVDFTALQAIETLKSKPYWASVTDLPFVGMNEAACNFTQCPIAQNENRTYDFQLEIAKALPRGKFDIKWKFWQDEESNDGCCARFYLRLS